MRDFGGVAADLECAVCGKTLTITVYPNEDAAGAINEEARDEGWVRVDTGWACNECKDLTAEEHAYLAFLAREGSI